jgi:putative aldouronate transport system permease protein
MLEERHIGDRVADAIIWAAVIVLSVICVLPFLTVLSRSVSGRSAVLSNQVLFWPVGFSVDNYAFLMRDLTFLTSFAISVARVLVGVTLNLALIIVTAYPLSQDHLHIPGRTVFKVLMVFGMLFDGGLIPAYMAYKSLGLLNRFAVLVLPGALNIFFAILMINFFRGIPRELSESALLDGANHLDVLVRVFMPLSLPSLATIGLFSAVNHWNAWFDGVVFLSRREMWPLQSYLYEQVTQKRLTMLVGENIRADPDLMRRITPEGLGAAMIVIGAVPIILVYPFVQRYFVRGLTLGAVKG